MGKFDDLYNAKIRALNEAVPGTTGTQPTAGTATNSATQPSAAPSGTPTAQPATTAAQPGQPAAQPGQPPAQPGQQAGVNPFAQKFANPGEGIKLFNNALQTSPNRDALAQFFATTGFDPKTKQFVVVQPQQQPTAQAAQAGVPQQQQG